MVNSLFHIKSLPVSGKVFLTGLLISCSILCIAPAQALRQQALTNVAPASPLEPADSLEGNFLSAYIAGASRDTGAAATYYREALKGDPKNTEILERAFVAFLADGAMQEAFQAAERMTAKEPGSGLAQLALGVRDLKLKQYASARAHLVKGGRGRAADLTATLLSAWAYAGSGQKNKALETIDRLNGERSYNVFRDYHGGLIADLVGNVPEAEKRLKNAYDLERTTLRVIDAYGRFESRRGNPEKAIAIYEEFNTLLPRHPIILKALQDLKSSRTLTALISSPQQGASEVLYSLGAAGNNQGDELPAVIYLRLALYLDGEHPLALITLSDIYERLKQSDRAIEALNRIPQTSPVRTSADVQIGLNLEQMGRGDEAVAKLETLMRERPDDVEVITALGNVLRSRKQFAEAAEVYTKAIEKIGTPDRSHWTLFYYRGSSYERSKQWPKAEADLKKALELIPDSQPSGKAQVLNYLGYSWVDMHMNIDEAFRLLQRAVELTPRDGMIVDSLGWAYYRLGLYEDAVRELEKAIDLKPADPIVNDHLGDAYWRVGRKLEANFQWQHARDNNPDPEDLVKIKRKLEVGLEDTKPATTEGEKVEDVKKNGG